MMLVALAAAAAAFTGCSEASSGGTPNAASSSTQSGPALARTEKFVAPYVKAPVWRGPATSPPVAQAKRIVYVNQLPTQPLFRAIGTAAKEAGQALGWNVTELDATTLNDLPEVFNRAIAQKPDGILFSNLSANEYPTITAALVKSKIPTVVIGVLPTRVNSSYTHVVDLHYPLQGQLIGAAAVLARQADAKVGVLGFAPGFDPSGEALIAGIKDYLASSGGGSVVATKTIDVATVTDPSAMGQASVAFAQANPALNAFFVGYDGTSSTVVPALRQAGLLNRLDVLAYQGDAQQLGWVRDGGGQVADVAWSQAWATWAAFDDFNRIFNKATPPADDGVPVRLFTKDNPPPAGTTTWSGDFAFSVKYKALWKTS